MLSGWFKYPEKQLWISEKQSLDQLIGLDFLMILCTLKLTKTLKKSLFIPFYKFLKMHCKILMSSNGATWLRLKSLEISPKRKKNRICPFNFATFFICSGLVSWRSAITASCMTKQAFKKSAKIFLSQIIKTGCKEP